MYKNNAFVKILLIGFLLLNGLRLLAQTDTEFWFVIPEVTINHQMPGAVPASFRFSSGNLPATVTISMPAYSATFPDIVIDLDAYDFHIEDLSCWIVSPCNPPFNPAGGYTDRDLLENKPYNTTGINNIGIRITSTTPITAYYEISRTNNKDIWALKGKNGLGKEFFVPFQDNKNNQSITPTQPYSAIDVVATSDNTVVTFQLPAGVQASYGIGPTNNVAAGGTLTRTLNRGQTFSLFPIGFSRTAANRLKGVRVTSTKNIAVNVKDDSFFHTGGSCYDLAGDQLVPTSIVSTEYIIIRTDLFQPTTPRTNEHDHIYILATQDNTTITVYNPDGSIPATTTPGIPYTNATKANPYTINSKQQLYVRLPAPLEFYRVVADKPVYVWHIGGFGCEQGGAILPPIDKCTGVPRVSFARTSIEPFYMIMMVRKGAENNFRFMVQDPANSGTFVDKTFLLQAPISFPFIPVDDSEWSVRRFGPFTTAQIPVTSHYMENSQDIFHLGIVNGNQSSGCFYGYFSDYNEFDPGTFVVESGAPGGKICYGESRQLYASGGTTYKWTPDTYLDDDEIATPLATNITGDIEYNVNVSGACSLSEDLKVQIKVGGPVYCDFEADPYEGCATKVNPADPAEVPGLDVTFTSLSTGDEFRWWYYRLAGDPNVLFASRDNALQDPDLARVVTFRLPNNTADTLRYYITLNVCDALSNCFQDVTKEVLVYPYINVDPTISVDEGCHGVSATFTANPTGNFGSSSFSWDFDDGGSSNSENPTHSFNNFDVNTVTFVPKVTLTDRFNFCQATDSVNIDVYPYIKASFVIDQPEGCSPYTVSVVNDSKGGITTYQWDRDGNTTYEHTGAGNWSLLYTNDNLPANTPDVIPITLQVSNIGGCTDVFSRNVTVNPRATASILSNITTDPNCAPLGVDFTSNTTNATVFNWFLDGVGIANTANTSYSFDNFTAAPVTRAITFNATNQWGCNAPTQSLNVTVNPYVEAILSLSSEVGCAPLDVVFTNSSSLGSSVIQWNVDGVNVANPNTLSPFSNPSVTNTVRPIPVTLTASNTAGCTDTDTRTINVNPRAISNFTYVFEDEDGNVLAPGDPLCSPIFADFTEQTTNAIYYNWQFGDLGASVLEDPFFIFSNTSGAVKTVQVDLLANNEYNCSDLFSQTFDIRPEVRANFSLDNASGCVPLTFNVAAPPLAVGSYLWDITQGAAPFFNDTGDSHTFTINQNQTGADEVYTITLRASDGVCSDISTPQTVIVYPQVEAKWDLPDPFFPECSPYNLSLTNQSTLYNDATVLSNVFWEFSDNSTSTLQSVSKSFVNDGYETTQDYTASLIAISSDGCSDTIETTIVVNPPVDARFNTEVLGYCTPMQLRFSDASLVQSLTPYNWNFGGGTQISQVGETYVIEYDNPDPEISDSRTVTLDLINSFGCNDSHSYTFDVYPRVVAQHTIAATSTDIICAPDSIYFSNNSTGGILSFLWDFGDSTYYFINNENDVGHAYVNRDSLPAVYDVTLIASNSLGCTDTTAVTIPVTIYPQVEANFTISLPPDSTCSPIEVTFNNNSLNGSDFDWEYTWISGTDNEQYSRPNLVHNYIFGNTTEDSLIYSIYFTATSDHFDGLGNLLISCSDVSPTQTVTVLPELNLLYLNPDTICSDQTMVYLKGTSTGGTANLIWDFADGTSATSLYTDFDHFFENLGPDNFILPTSVTATQPNGCRKSQTIPVMVHPRVESDFSFTIPDVCAYPLRVDFTNASLNGSDYVWDYGYNYLGVDQGETLPTNDPHTYSFYNVDPDDEVVYNISLTSRQFHAISGLTCLSFPRTRPITVYPELIADFTATERGCNPLTVNFVNLSQGLAGGTYLWDFGDESGSDNETPASRVYSHNNKNASEFFDINLTIANPLGCKTDVTRTVEVYPLVVSEFVVSDGLSGCTDLTISAVNTSTSAQYNYLWVYGDGRPNTTAAQPGSGGSITYSNKTNNPPIIERPILSLTATYRNDATCTHTTSKMVTVYPHVYPDFTTDFDGCQPHSATFDNLTSVYSTNTQYRWNFGNGTTSSAIEPTATFINNGYFDDVEYTVRLDATSEHGCTDFVEKVVTVHPNPRSRLEIVGQYVGCPPLDAEFQNLSTGTNLTFHYDFGDGTDSITTSSDNMAHGYTNLQEEIESFVITLTSETEYGCLDISTQSVHVFPGVEVDFEFSPDAACNPHTPEIRNFTQGTAYYYYWDFDDGTHSYLREPIHRFVNTTADDRVYNVTHTAMTAYNCEDSQTLPLTVYAAPITEFLIDPPLQKFPDATFTFTNQTSPASDNWSYTWEYGDGYGSQDRNPEPHTYERWGPRELNFTYPVSLYITTGFCEDTKVQFLTLLPPEPISAYTINGDTASCSPLEVYFINESFYDFGDSCQWDFDDGNFSDQCSEVSHVFTEPGFYNVRLTVYGDGGINYSYQTFVVYRNPIADFEVVPEQVMLPDATVRLFNTTQFGETYEWDFGDGSPVTDIRNPFHTYEEMGEYRISLTAWTKEGCVDVASKFPAVWVLGRGQIRFPNAFVPNPGGPNGGYYDDVDYRNEVFHPYSDGVTEYKLTVFNRWGETIFESSDIKVGWDGYYQGKLCPQDVYVWRSVGKFANGQQFDLRGNVTLLR